MTFSVPAKVTVVACGLTLPAAGITQGWMSPALPESHMLPYMQQLGRREEERNPPPASTQLFRGLAKTAQERGSYLGLEQDRFITTYPGGNGCLRKEISGIPLEFMNPTAPRVHVE